MRFCSSSKRAMLLGVIGVVLALSFPGASRASNLVFPGYDLFETLPGTTFAGVPFTGVSLGTFDFGGGVQNVGNTDTIVQRKQNASAPSTSIPVELVALQLESTVPTDFGLGVDFYFITLQSARGGPATTGVTTINFGPEGTPHGTFNSFFDVFFDVRKGALNGPIALADSLILTSTGTPWGHDPAPGEVIIDGVNHYLNGSDLSNDSHPIGAIQEIFSSGAMIVVQTTIAAVPEPGSFALSGVGALMLVLMGVARNTVSPPSPGPG